MTVSLPGPAHPRPPARRRGRSWRVPGWSAGLAFLVLTVTATPSAGQGGGEPWVDDSTDYGYPDAGIEAGYPTLTTRVWLDRGEEPVLERGERVRVYYRASTDAFVSVFHIDTNGTLRLLYPRSPDENHYVFGGRDFRLVFPSSSSWLVTDDPGVGYFFALASSEPFDFRDFRFSPYAGGWDLRDVGRRVYSDPYVAMDDVVARLIPDWEVVPYALDFSTYHVERRYEYPRFLCYDCHGFRPYASWNPYLATCSSFRIVVYDDPYYYPATRYVGMRVVYSRPVSPGLPRFEFKERARGETAAPLVVERRAVPRSDRAVQPGVGRVGPGLDGAGPGRTLPPSVGRLAPERTRPSQVLPGRGVPGSVRTPPTAGSGRSGAVPPTRPTLERRPPASPPPSAGRGGTPTRGGGAVRPPTRSSGGSGGAVRPPARSSGGSGGAARPPTRSSGGSGGAVRPPTRSSAGSPPPPTRSSGGSARPPVRRGGGGGG